MKASDRFLEWVGVAKEESMDFLVCCLLGGDLESCEAADGIRDLSRSLKKCIVTVV